MQIALTLENNGSVARDHLAAERTYLAYVRTSLVLASTGVALVQLFSVAASASTDDTTFSPVRTPIHRYSRPLGATTVLLSLLFLGVGIVRYFSIQNKLMVGVFPVARMFTVFLAITLASLITIVFAIILARTWYVVRPALSLTNGHPDSRILTRRRGNCAQRSIYTDLQSSRLRLHYPTCFADTIVYASYAGGRSEGPGAFLLDGVLGLATAPSRCMDEPVGESYIAGRQCEQYRRI